VNVCVACMNVRKNKKYKKSSKKPNAVVFHLTDLLSNYNFSVSEKRMYSRK
jgi:hypothetical protein